MSHKTSVEIADTTAPPRRPGLGRVWLLTVGILTCAVVGWAILLPNTSSVSEDPWPWWVFVSIFVVGKYLRVELATTGAQPMSFVMTDAAFVIALLLAEPYAIPLSLCAAALSSAVAIRPPLVKIAFNLAQELAGAALGLLTFELIRDDRLISARTGFAALVGGAAVGLFSHRAVAFVTRLASGQSEQAPGRSLVLSSIGSIGNGAVALQAVYLGSISPPLAFVPAVLLVVLYLGYRLVQVQQRSTDRTELLYRTTAALHEQPNMDEGLLSVLEEVRGALRAQSARIVLLAAEGAVTCATSEDGSPGSAMTAAPPVEESAARRLATELPGAVLLRSGTPAVASGPVSVFAKEDAIVAPVVRGGEPAGVVLVLGRAGGVDALSQTDVDLVELLAKQIGLALERGFLERSLRQLIELEQQLTKQAYYDAVTGLANRNFLNDELDRLLNPATSRQSAVLLLDLDDFKTVNDSLGHVAGDRLLAIVAERLVQAVGDSGLVTRIGGDEFAVVMPAVSDQREVTVVADQMIEAVSQMVHLDGRDVGIGASVGIRLTQGHPDQATDLLRDADLALYNAKALGKGRCALFEPSMHTQAQERLILTAALANAVERDEFALVFQPIVALPEARLAGVEALVRWRHPERGEIGPAQFLGLTEESGLIVGLGRHILRQALAQLREWLPLIGHESFYVSVNVSARQLKESDFAESVLSLVEESGVPPEFLVLEITESVFIDDVRHTKEVLDRITSKGIRISLDDFGTGYSSLSQIQQLPLHQLKVDQSFVRRLGPGRDGRVVVRAIIQLAQAMHLDAVAEGIETPVQLEELVALGCVKGQGWLFSRPRSGDAIGEMLVDRRDHQAVLT